MSCNENQRRLGPVSVANGIFPLANRLIGTFGSWNTWMDVKNLGDISEKTSGILTGMTGVANPAGALYLAGDLVFWLKDRKKGQAEVGPEMTAEQKERATRKKERMAAIQQLFDVDDVEAAKLAEKYNPDQEAELREATEKQKERVAAIKQLFNIDDDEAEELAGMYRPRPPQKEEPRRTRYPKIVSPIGAMIALHTFEAATGAAGTTATRLFLPGKPIGTWRNVVIRQDRLMPLKTKALSRLTGGRVIDSAGYYFHEGGRTWLCESYTLNLNGAARTMTRAYTLAVPKREHFFDRPLSLGSGQDNGTDGTPIGDDAHKRELPIQRVVDVVKGLTQPEQVPGYIGSTNELENITPLGKVKRSLFAASWFLVDESERDTGGGIGYADYQAALSGNSNASTQIYRRVDTPRSKTSSPIADYSNAALLRYDPKTDRVSTGEGGKGNPVPLVAVVSAAPAASSSSGSKSDTDEQIYYWGGRKLSYAELTNVTGRFVEDDNGTPRPMLLRDVLRSPLNGSLVPDAIYCDGERWRQVVDPAVLDAIAQSFQAGGIQKTRHWKPFVTGYEYPRLLSNL